MSSELKGYHFNIHKNDLNRLKEIKENNHIKNMDITVAFLLNVAVSNLIDDIEKNSLSSVISKYICSNE